MRTSRIVPVALALLAAAPTSLYAQGGEGGGGTPLFDINLGLSTWTLLVFAGLVFVLGKFAWGPILAAVEAREQGIQDAIDRAEAQNAEAARLLEEHRQQLADARRQANELVAEGKAAGERVRKEIEEKARSEGQAIIERARAEIERERDAALDALRSQSVELALTAASKLMHERFDQAKDRELVERFLDEVSPAGGARA